MNVQEMTNEELIGALHTMRITGCSRYEKEILEECCRRIEKLDRVERWVVEHTVAPKMRNAFHADKTI